MAWMMVSQWLLLISATKLSILSSVFRETVVSPLQSAQSTLEVVLFQVLHNEKNDAVGDKT